MSLTVATVGAISVPFASWIGECLHRFIKVTDGDVSDCIGRLGNFLEDRTVRVVLVHGQGVVCVLHHELIKIGTGTGGTVTANEDDLVVGVCHSCPGYGRPRGDAPVVDRFDLVKGDRRDRVCRVDNNGNTIVGDRDNIHGAVLCLLGCRDISRTHTDIHFLVDDRLDTNAGSTAGNLDVCLRVCLHVDIS